MSKDKFSEKTIEKILAVANLKGKVSIGTAVNLIKVYEALKKAEKNKTQGKEHEQRLEKEADYIEQLLSD